jgi:DNA polymerase-3 subunit epsilon
VCAGRENVHAHHARLLAALAPLKTADWPHAGAVGIVEADREREATDVHVVDRWCHLGTAHDDAELAELREQFSNGRRAPAFDYDHYRILARHLGKRGVHVVQLGR